MPPENHCYTKVVLNESTLVEFASEFTRHMRMNQGWSTLRVIVEPIEFRELPPLGKPTHIEGDLNTWIVE